MRKIIDTRMFWLAAAVGTAIMALITNNVIWLMDTMMASAFFGAHCARH